MALIHKGSSGNYWVWVWVIKSKGKDSKKLLEIKVDLLFHCVGFDFICRESFPFPSALYNFCNRPNFNYSKKPLKAPLHIILEVWEVKYL